MKVIIDAYNLYHLAKRRAGQSDPLTVGAFVQMLNAWAKRTNSTVTLVFDGTTPPTAPHQPPNDLTIVLAGPDQSADHAIIELINSYSAARTLLVVSTDRAIRRHAKRRRCTVLTSDRFWQKLLATPTRPSTPREPKEKRAGLTDRKSVV